jgi:hypothetical protein
MDIENRVKYYMGKYYKSKIYHDNIPLKYIKNGIEFKNSKTLILKKDLIKNLDKNFNKNDIEYHYIKPLIEILDKIISDDIYFLYCWGDISHSIGREGVITKTRPRNNKTMILQKLVYYRHWNQTNFEDVKKYDKTFRKKINKAVWRGSSTGFIETKGSRFDLVKKYFNHHKIDVGFSKIVQNKDKYQKYLKNNMTIKDQLNYKFIISVEGNDVASGLKWQLLSNSIVLMRKPTIESWLMEFRLRPYVHYVPLKDDFSDIEEQINWCNNNYERCLDIINRSKTYMEQFLNLKKEEKIRKKIFIRYFENIHFNKSFINKEFKKLE